MTISYPITLPASPVPARVSFIARHVVGRTASPFTGEQQIQQFNGQWWEAVVEYAPMNRASADGVAAALMQLLGGYGTLFIHDPAATTARGTVAGTPLVNGASQTGNSLITDGWSAGATILAGDYIQLGSSTTTRLYRNLKDVTADGSGNATLDIFPRLRESPGNNDAITKASCKGTFRLLGNDVEWTTDDAMLYGIAFRAIEAI